MSNQGSRRINNAGECAHTRVRMIYANDDDDDSKRKKKTLDPILTLQVPQEDETTEPSSEESTTEESSPGRMSLSATVTSLCFFNSKSPRQLTSNTSSESSDSSDDEDFQLQCAQLLKYEKSCDTDVTAKAREVSASLSLLETGRWLGTCHANGDNYLWDLGQRRILQEITVNRGPGLVLRRLVDDDPINKDDSRFFYQTRDSKGTISLHHLDASSTRERNGISLGVSSVAQLETKSQTFCAAAPCRGNPNLVVMPCEEHSFAIVRDWRVPSHNSPVAIFHGVQGIGKGREQLFSSSSFQKVREHGMLTSLAMSESNTHAIIACGMESGAVVFHDLAMLNGTRSDSEKVGYEPCRLSLSTDPILSLDVTPTFHSKLQETWFAVGGMAGNAEDLEELPEPDRGRVAVIKASLKHSGELQAQVRTRLSTVNGGSVQGSDTSKEHQSIVSGNNTKPGVAVCRFRPDGYIFAVGGWDRRLRIFDSQGTALAILRGHTDSVHAMDWSNDAAITGLLATGSSDGRVHIWRCFPSTSRTTKTRSQEIYSQRLY